MALDPRDRAELANAGRKTREWLATRDRLIRKCNENGASLREIGDAVGLSNTGVLRILRKANVHGAEPPVPPGHP